jgi:hypothetical protein
MVPENKFLLSLITADAKKVFRTVHADNDALAAQDFPHTPVDFPGVSARCEVQQAVQATFFGCSDNVALPGSTAVVGH